MSDNVQNCNHVYGKMPTSRSLRHCLLLQLIHSVHFEPLKQSQHSLDRLITRNILEKSVSCLCACLHVRLYGVGNHSYFGATREMC
jgi:hypothetical protein